MMLEPRHKGPTVREIKVKVPLPVLLKLHAQKVATGVSISDAVVDALRVHFYRLGVPVREDPPAGRGHGTDPRSR